MLRSEVVGPIVVVALNVAAVFGGVLVVFVAVAVVVVVVPIGTLTPGKCAARLVFFTSNWTPVAVASETRTTFFESSLNASLTSCGVPYLFRGQVSLA